MAMGRGSNERVSSKLLTYRNETVLFTQDLSLACSGFPVDLVINSSRVVSLRLSVKNHSSFQQVQKYVQIRVDHNCHTKSEDQILRTATDASVQGVEWVGL